MQFHTNHITGNRLRNIRAVIDVEVKSKAKFRQHSVTVYSLAFHKKKQKK